MRRREFIAGLGGASAWPLVAGAQQQAKPVIGILGSTTAEGRPDATAAFMQGLKEAGFIEGRLVEASPRRRRSTIMMVPITIAIAKT
jgi:putative tryptophan/tyrosine transport system substrate-binding protein